MPLASVVPIIKTRWKEFETAAFEAASTFCVSPSAASEILSRLLVIVKDVRQLRVLQSVILSFLTGSSAIKDYN